MSETTRWVLRIAGVVLLMVSAAAVLVAPRLLWVSVPIVCVWGVWLVIDYLQWARSLGKR